MAAAAAAASVEAPGRLTRQGRIDVRLALTFEDWFKPNFNRSLDGKQRAGPVRVAQEGPEDRAASVRHQLRLLVPGGQALRLPGRLRVWQPHPLRLVRPLPRKRSSCPRLRLACLS